VLAFARRLFRRLLPRRIDPLLDVPRTVPADAAREQQYLAAIGEERRDPFLASRYSEGIRWRGVLAAYLPPPARLLDIGAGNGAVELAMATGGYSAVSVDTEWNATARALGARRVIADATALPFRERSFDAVLLLEAVEHLPRPAQVSAQAAGVLRTGGCVLVTTPPRWRFALRGDPHFGIPLLLLLPPSLQRAVAARHGFGQRHHYVARIYSSAPQVVRALAPLRLRAVLSRSRAPLRWFWDALLLVKSGED
jgi:SAM-dependent methyltransferase